MTGYRLRNGVSFCRIGKRHIFFDIPSDRYFGLTDELDRSFASIADPDNPFPNDPQPLMDLGLVVRAPDAGRPQRCAHPLPSPNQVLLPTAHSSPMKIAGALTSRLIWSRRVKRRALSKNLGALNCKRDRLPARAPDQALFGTVRGYSDAALIWSDSGRCLATSMALMNDLIGLGFAVQLVFAVRIDPFHAHCWVEWQGLPLCTEPDALNSLTPIRVV